MDQIQYRLESKIGKIYLLACEQGLTGIYFSPRKTKSVSNLNPKNPAEKILIKAGQQINEYIEGKRKSFDLPLYFESGTDFQKKVWQALTKIPYGKTISYKELAHNVKSPKAVRAVGSANGKNPFCMIVPCHRVIASSGKLGGYAGGLSVKEKLLALEKSI